ncbi:MAG: 16S rRNA (cytosine(967)-C(5))-methyltransferase RsmB [Deltaproteobacteria bacterium]|nr:16S rRNA (cytosine(967)-C(5))-methyltransferase RsmB [Candidatus Anaeroferrophillus wilburensis]MBN2889025.1 16S rRNA (cytosine(967)-C(5))-methyltransferase RsmB [Deltaproteobacteria bacterium]
MSAGKKSGSQAATMSVIKIAWQALVALEANPAPTDHFLDQLFSHQGSALAPQGRARITNLVAGTIKWRRRLDWIIDQLASRTKKVDPKVRSLLRLALYQLEFLSGTPNYAVVSETVQLAKAATPGREGFVNGLLRTFLRTGQETLFAGLTGNPTEVLGITHSLPSWLVTLWLADYGYQQTEKLCRQANNFAGTTFRVNRLQLSRDAFLQQIPGYQTETAATGDIIPTRYAPDGFTSQQTGRWLASPAFANGTITVQDEGAQMISYLLNPVPGQLILDACAAPGGKTGHLAELSNDQATIVAADSSRQRLELLEKTRSRLQLHSIQPLLTDLTKPLPGYAPCSFDAILVDAPCSGLGVMRRRADLRWRKQPRELEQLATIQLQILTNCSTYLKKGGRLVYATCTSNIRENQGVVRAFLAANPYFSPLPRQQSGPDWLAPMLSPSGCLETFFHEEGNMDGFFAAVLTHA